MQARRCLIALLLAAGLVADAKRAYSAVRPSSGAETSDSKQNVNPRANAGAEHREDSASEPADAAFLKKTSDWGLKEKRLGELASARGSTEAVKELGRKMYDDHSRLNAQLRLLAAEKHLTLPKDSAEKEEPAIVRLEKLTGAEFDKAFAEQIVKDHKQAVQDFQRAARSAQDQGVKAFAEKTLPQLKQHLDQAQHLTVKRAKPSS